MDVGPSFINRSKAVSSRLKTGGIYIGIVTRVNSGSLFMRVPKLGSKVEFGPCVYSGITPQVDDRVLVGFLDNQLSELVCFGVLSRDSAALQYVNNALAEKAQLNASVVTTAAVSYTLSAEDNGVLLDLNNSSPSIVTIETDTAESTPIGMSVRILRRNTGTVTIDGATGVLLNNSASAFSVPTQFGVATILKRAANEWILFGDYA